MEDIKQNTAEHIKYTPHPDCPLCNTKGHLLYQNLTDRLFDSSGKWNIAKCPNKNCGLLWLNPMPKSDEIWKAYRNYYTHSDSKSPILSVLRPLEKSFISIKYKYKSKESFLKKLLAYLIYLFPTEHAEIDMRVFYLKSEPGKNLLDIGCGDGGLIERLSELGWEVHGIDFDENAVAHCKQKGLDVRAGDILSQKFANATFDVITFNHVIEHLFNPVEVIKECYRILKPGGKLVLATPNNKSWMYRNIFQQNWFSLDPPRHVLIYNRKNLSGILEQQNFRIEVNKTTIRNEFYVYTGSKSIRNRGVFAMGKEKPNRVHMLQGKFVQLYIWFLLLFEKDAGGEVLIKAVKPDYDGGTR